MLVALEAKGIALVHETARILGHPFFVVVRKTVKKYMVSPLMVPVTSIRSGGSRHWFSMAAMLNGSRGIGSV